MGNSTESMESSTERSGLLVTYLDKKKRKRTLSNPADFSSGSVVKSKPSTSPTHTPKSPKTPGTKHGPGKVEVTLPGPSPKRVRCDSNKSDKPMTKKTIHVRAASSVTSLKQITKQPHDASAKKPESAVSSTHKPISKAKSIADNDDDDSISVAESNVSTGRVRRNEAERIQYFENQPECGKMEPHQVHCLRCNKYVNLGRRQTYTVRPWEIHRVRCDQRPAYAPPAMPEANEASATAQVPESSPFTLSVTSKPTPARRLSEQERKEFLESDKQLETVEEYRVFCRKCQNWVELSQTHAYITGNWMKHKVRCSDAVPSHRVAAAKRRLNLVNDPQVKSLDAQNVICAICNITVKLEGDNEFNSTKWEEHKRHCTKHAPDPQTESASSISFPDQATRPPPSSASTEDTVVVDVGSSQPSRPHSGLKRPREESDTVPKEEDHRTNRPRTESYSTADIDPPNSLLGWFMMPFHSFVRGFQESLTDRS